MKLKLCLVLSAFINIFCSDIEKVINDNVQNKIEISNQIEKTKLQMLATVNTILNMRNWHLGKLISENQSRHQWGFKYLHKLSVELKNLYPQDSGFSLRNLKYMKLFAKSYNENEAAAVAQIPWGHNIIILDKIKGKEERLWYAKKSLELNWTRRELEENINNCLYDRNKNN